MKNILKKSVTLLCILGTLNLIGCDTEDITTSSDIKDFKYNFEGDHVIINKYIGDNNNVVFPNEIDGSPVGIININPTENSEFLNIKSAIVPDSVTDIKNSFDGLKELNSVTLGNGVTQIDNCAFRNCESLEVIKLGENITTIGREAFKGDKNLKSIDIPNSVSIIYNNAFSNCSSLESINLGSNLTQIGTYYDDWSAISVGETDVFSYNKSLSSINVDENNQVYCSVDGVLYSKDMTKLIKYPMGKTETSFEIPDSVTTICSYALDNCTEKNLTVVIPDNVNILENFCFEGDITIVCSKGSTADLYAQAYEFSYRYN